MKLENKKKIIQALDEAELREKLLIPLFTKMGFIDPILHHHSNEKGKDIILKEFDNKFKKTEYLSVVVKAGNVTGSSSSSSGYFALLNQIKQSLNEPYKHIYELKEVFVDKVIVVISGKFLPTSLESIYGTLKAERLDKAIREPIDINKLPDLIDEHFPEYWEEYKNETKSLIEQRNNLLNNLSKLSKVLFPDFKNQEAFLQKVSKSEYDIELLPYKSLNKYIANIGYKRISIDEIDEFYTDMNISNYYADIKSHFFEIKEKTQRVLYDFDEVIEILKAILDEKNPLKMMDLTEDLKSYVGRVGFNFSSNDIESQEDFYYGLKEYKTKKDLLIKNNCLEFYNHVHDIISSKSEEELVNFYSVHPKDEKDIWLGFILKIDFDNKKIKELKFYKNKETPKSIVSKSSISSPSKEIQRNSRAHNSEIKVEVAVNNYGVWKEQEMTVEMKAKSFVWHYTRGFEKMFFEILGLEEE